MTQVHPQPADAADALAAPFTPGAPSNPPELAEYPETLAGHAPVPLADPRTREFVEEWRNASYNCYSSGHKFCREVCPVTQVTRNESWTPTAFHANVVAMEQGELDVADVAADYVNCTQCGACELRCPNTLFTGDFYRFRTRTVDVVKAVRALAVESGIHQPQWQRWNERTDRRTHEPVLGDTPVSQDRVRDWADGSGHPDRRRDDPLRRLRGGVLPDRGAAGGRADAAAGRVRVRPDARAVVLRRPGRRDGLRRPGARGSPSTTSTTGARSAPSGSSCSTRTTTSASPRTTRSTSATTSTSRSCSSIELLAELIREGRLTPTVPVERRDHLPRPVPAEQAQGHLAGAARDPARHPRPDFERRRPRDPVVLLLRRRWRPADREARAHRGDQRDAGWTRRPSSTSTRWSAPARGPSGRWARPASQHDIDVVDIHELLARVARHRPSAARRGRRGA